MTKRAMAFVAYYAMNAGGRTLSGKCSFHTEEESAFWHGCQVGAALALQALLESHQTPTVKSLSAMTSPALVAEFLAVCPEFTGTDRAYNAV